MSDVAGGNGEHKGVAFAGLTYKFDKTGHLRIDEQYAVDVFDSFYTDLRVPLAIDETTNLLLGAQYYPQSAVGDQQIGAFSTWGYGLQAALSRGPLDVQLYWTQTGEGGDTLNPFGVHPSYLNLMQVGSTRSDPFERRFRSQNPGRPGVFTLLPTSPPHAARSRHQARPRSRGSRFWRQRAVRARRPSRVRSRRSARRR